MPGSTSKTSTAAEGASSDHSVLDFLYHDSRRIGSFLAQFEPYGHLQQITQTKDGAKGKKEVSTTEAKGSVGVVGGGYTGSTENTVDLAQGYEKLFDPYWANARAFLNYANEHDLLVQDASKARFGQLLHAKGQLGVMDITMLRAAWDVKTIQSQIKGGMNAGTAGHTHSAAAKAAKKKSDELADFMIDMLKIMPHAVQAFFATPEGTRIWGTLASENLVTPPGDLALKHGIMIPGEWNVVAIVDALPTPEVADDDYATQAQQAVIDTLTLLGGSPISQVALHVAPAAKLLLGRPNSALGVTPLLIFREVK